jgi:hypothetical protein
MTERVRVTNWTVSLDWSNGNVSMLEDIPEPIRKSIQDVVDKAEQEANDQGQDKGWDNSTWQRKNRLM